MSDLHTERGFEDGYPPRVEFRGGARVSIWSFRGETAPSHVVRSQLARIVRGAPEVIVKVSGRIYGARNLARHLDYISRAGRLALVGPDGERAVGREDNRDLTSRWSFEALAAGCGRSIAVPLILSMPAGADPDRVREAVSTFASSTFGDQRPYVFVLHEDQPHPHVHLTVHALGQGGRKLDPNRGVLQAWREAFAQELRSLGVDAEASPRWARGVTLRRDSTPLRKLRGRWSAGDGPMPSRLRNAYVDAALVAFAGVPAPAGQVAALQKHGDYRRRLVIEAGLLAQAQEPQERALGLAAMAFLRELPEPRTRRQELAEQLRSSYEKDHGRGGKPGLEPAMPSLAGPSRERSR